MFLITVFNDKSSPIYVKQSLCNNLDGNISVSADIIGD